MQLNVVSFVFKISRVDCLRHVGLLHGWTMFGITFSSAKSTKRSIFQQFVSRAYCLPIYDTRSS